MQPETNAAPWCARHPTVAAVAACHRCGVFACEGCGKTELDVFLCTACLARPEARLQASPRAKRALVLAVLSLHGLVFLLPFAIAQARAELRDIDAARAPTAGKPWVDAALRLAWLTAAAALAIAVYGVTRLL